MSKKIIKLEEKTLEELKKIATSLGVSDTSGFNSKSSLVATIRAIKNASEQAKKDSINNMPINPVQPQKPEEAKPIENDNDRWLDKAMRTKEALSKQEKVSFIIPLGFKEKKGTIETVIINGYRYEIKKGVMVQLPKQVAQILADAYQLEMDAGEEFKLDREKTLDNGRTVNVKEVLIR